MATISFFAGFEIRDKEKALRVLEALKESGTPVSLTPEERELFRKSIGAVKEMVDILNKDFLKEEK